MNISRLYNKITPKHYAKIIYIRKATLPTNFKGWKRNVTYCQEDVHTTGGIEKHQGFE